MSNKKHTFSSQKALYMILISASVLVAAVSAIISTHLIASVYLPNPFYYVPAGLALLAVMVFSLFIALNIESKKARAVSWIFYLFALTASIATVYLYIALSGAKQHQSDQQATLAAQNNAITRDNATQQTLIAAATEQIKQLQAQNNVSNTLLIEYADAAINGKYKSRYRANGNIEAKKIATRDAKIEIQQAIISKALASKQALLIALPTSKQLVFSFNAWILLQAALLDIFALILQILARFVRQSSTQQTGKAIQTLQQSIKRLNRVNAEASQTCTHLVGRLDDAHQTVSTIKENQQGLETFFKKSSEKITTTDKEWRDRSQVLKEQRAALANQAKSSLTIIETLNHANKTATGYIEAIEQLKVELSTASQQSINTAEQARKAVNAAQSTLKQDIETLQSLTVDQTKVQTQAETQQSQLIRTNKQAADYQQKIEQALRQADQRIVNSKELSQSALTAMQTHNQRFYTQQREVEQLSHKLQQDVMEAAQELSHTNLKQQQTLIKTINETREVDQLPPQPVKSLSISTQTGGLKPLNPPAPVSIEFNQSSKILIDTPIDTKQSNGQEPVSIKVNRQRTPSIKVNEQANEQANEQRNVSIKVNEQSNGQRNVSIKKQASNSAMDADIQMAIEVLKAGKIKQSDKTKAYTNEAIVLATGLPYNKLKAFKKQVEMLGLVTFKKRGNGLICIDAQNTAAQADVLMFERKA